MRGLLLVPIAVGVMFGEQATGQDSTGSELILVKRQVDITVQENMAYATLVFKVKNPSERTLEGEITFQAPPGGAACDVTLLRHIASTERRSKVMPPEDAAALYAAVKSRGMRQEELAKLSQFMKTAGFPFPASGNFGQAADPSRRLLDGMLHPVEDRSVDTTPPAIPTVPTNPVPTPPTMPPDDPPTEPPDPAILESSGTDTYRLRFFPIPATTDQTVTVVLAFEVARTGDEYDLRLPLRFASNFRRSAKTEDSLQVEISSRTPLGKVSSTTHSLATVVAGDRRLNASAASRESDAEFGLHYVLDPKAKLFDFGRKVDWTKLHPSQEKRFTATDAYCAIVGKRAIDALSREDVEKGQIISNVSHAVSPQAALIVIESWVARELGGKKKP